MVTYLRLVLGRLLARASEAENGLVCYAVPVTVRALTSDGADMRLLLQVRVEGSTLEAHDRERFVHAVTIPATRQWIERHDLADLARELIPAIRDIEDVVKDPLAEIGLTLLDVELVAAEHLLTSPSTGSVDGPR